MKLGRSRHYRYFEQPFRAGEASHHNEPSVLNPEGNALDSRHGRQSDRGFQYLSHVFFPVYLF